MDTQILSLDINKKSEANYFIKVFSLSQISELLVAERISIPKFQRGIAWKEKRRKGFIATLREGDPFGAILLHPEKAASDGMPLYVIDGLQRLSTIFDYIKNPKEYLDTIVFPEDLFKKLDALRDQKKKVDHADYKSLIFEFYREGGAKAAALADKFRKKFDIPADKSEVYEISEDINDLMRRQTELKDVQVPVIIYTGKTESLPDVFYRLNTGSVQLSKYEIFAAGWSTAYLDIDDEEISARVEKKFVSLEEKSGLSVKYDPEELRKKVTVFEYCYALSEILKDGESGFTEIYGEKSSEAHSADAIGFEILALIFGKKINETEWLREILVQGSPKFLKSVKEAIKDTSRELQLLLSPWMTIQGQKNFMEPGGYQILHMFISLFQLKYQVDAKNRSIQKLKGGSDKLALFRHFAPVHFFVDNLTDYWAENRQVGDLDDNLKDASKLNKYQHAISKERLVKIVSEWMDVQDGDARKRVPAIYKLFLNSIHLMVMRENHMYAQAFKDQKLDVEHICAKEHLKDLEDSGISHIANLCLLTIGDNRSKKEKSLHQDVKTKPLRKINTEIAKLILYPEASELGFLSLNTDEKKPRYVAFLHERGAQLQKLFVDVVHRYESLIN